MTKSDAEEILDFAIRPNGDLFNLGQYIAWNVGDKDITLDADFSIDELEAIVWWMKNVKTA